MVHSLEAAFWAFHDAKDFRHAVPRTVNLDDDADTTGAVCGPLGGAYWDESKTAAEGRNGWPAASTHRSDVHLNQPTGHG